MNLQTNNEKKFISFVWGRSRLPAVDEEFTTKFSINAFYHNSYYADQHLPKAHTCFFTIDLPNYSTKAIMKEKLIYAIENCRALED